MLRKHGKLPMRCRTSHGAQHGLLAEVKLLVVQIAVEGSDTCQIRVYAGVAYPRIMWLEI